eukprot:m.9304 g.9304  ORF g.9304 m.9304 type:complete len:84 (+) comp4159_c0_seq2:22-273(+)
MSQEHHNSYTDVSAESVHNARHLVGKLANRGVRCDRSCPVESKNVHEAHVSLAFHPAVSVRTLPSRLPTSTTPYAWSVNGTWP